MLGRRSGVAAVVTEIEMRTSIGGADAATGGTALSSTPGAGTAANGFDNNTGTSFASIAADPAWIGYDFGAPIAIAEVAVSLGATSGTRPYSFNVEYSDDGTRWCPVVCHDINGQAVSTTVVAPVPAEIGAWVGSPVILYDDIDGGVLSLDGTCEVDGTPTDTPVQRKVRLFELSSGRLVRETWSAPVTGAWSFTRLKQNTYFIVSHDHSAVNEAVVVDRVVPT